MWEDDVRRITVDRIIARTPIVTDMRDLPEARALRESLYAMFPSLRWPSGGVLRYAPVTELRPLPDIRVPKAEDVTCIYCGAKTGSCQVLICPKCKDDPDRFNKNLVLQESEKVPFWWLKKRKYPRIK